MGRSSSSSPADSFFTAMAWVPALIIPGMAVARIARHYTSDEEDQNRKDNLKAQETCNQSVVDRLTAGAAPPVSFWSEQQLERMIKTNSAMKDRADELREARVNKGANRMPETVMGA